MEPGESFEGAATREAAEELGMARVPLVPLWESTSEYLHEGRPVLLEAKFFLLRVPLGGIEFTEAVLEAHRRDRIFEARWWSVAELEGTRDLVFPEGLSQRLKDLAREG